MEPISGLEPETSSLPRKCSTTELHGQIWNNKEKNLLRITHNKVFQRERKEHYKENGAGEGARSLNIQLGRLTL
jgi:hypothetical protein